MLQFTRDPIRSCRNIADLRDLASRRVPAPMFHYIDGAAEDEWTLRLARSRRSAMLRQDRMGSRVNWSMEEATSYELPATSGPGMARPLLDPLLAGVPGPYARLAELSLARMLISAPRPIASSKLVLSTP